MYKIQNVFLIFNSIAVFLHDFLSKNIENIGVNDCVRLVSHSACLGTKWRKQPNIRELYGAGQWLITF